MIRSLAAILALAAAAVDDAPQAPTANVLPLPEHTARYAVFRRGRQIGYAALELSRQNDGTYDYKVETTATTVLLRLLGVTAAEHGRFSWEEGTIRPISYAQLVERPGRNRFWEAEFDWEAMQAAGESHHGPLRVNVARGVLDPLTLRLQFAVRLATEGLPKPAYEFMVLERDEVEKQSFVVRGREQFEFAGGCVSTVRMERLREDTSRNYFSWHTEQFHWMPVRIRQVRDGREELDIHLVESSLPLDVGDCDG